jgi:hypothetical protein
MPVSGNMYLAGPHDAAVLDRDRILLPRILLEYDLGSIVAILISHGQTICRYTHA